jgi:hypothetical protein
MMRSSLHNRIAHLLGALALATLLLLLVACGGGGSAGGGGGIGGTGSPSTLGTVRFSLTDAPACGYAAVNVTIERVRIHASSSAGEADAGWSEVVLAPARRFNLLDLTNGVLAELGTTTLPPGRYTQLRLVLATNGGATPLANSVQPSGGSETALTTPSAQQSGIKVGVDVDIAAGQTADVVLDFDACRSVVRRGNSGQFNLKPVISATAVVSTVGPRVDGYVVPALAAGGATVSLQSAGVPVKSTKPDANGAFVLFPVPAGTYDLVVAAPARVTAVVTGVPVTASAVTTLGSVAVPINPTAVPSLSFTGSVTPATGTVRALQAYSGGPTVEAAFAPVDATNGAYALTLPIGTPLKAAYEAGAASPAFMPDPTAASKFTIQAASGSATKQQAIDLGAALPALNFAFP